MQYCGIDDGRRMTNNIIHSSEIWKTREVSVDRILITCGFTNEFHRDNTCRTCIGRLSSAQRICVVVALDYDIGLHYSNRRLISNCTTILTQLRFLFLNRQSIHIQIIIVVCSESLFELPIVYLYCIWMEVPQYAVWSLLWNTISGIAKHFVYCLAFICDMEISP